VLLAEWKRAYELEGKVLGGGRARCLRPCDRARRPRGRSPPRGASWASALSS